MRCSPTPNSARRLMLSGTSSGPAASPIPSMPSNSYPFSCSLNNSTSGSRMPSVRLASVGRRLSPAGTNGQFSPPRHIFRMVVKMLDPRPGERLCDPAAGTCGFLVNAWQHLRETHTDPRDLNFDEDGWPHGLTGSRLKREEW